MRATYQLLIHSLSWWSQSGASLLKQSTGKECPTHQDTCIASWWMAEPTWDGWIHAVLLWQKPVKMGERPQCQRWQREVPSHQFLHIYLNMSALQSERIESFGGSVVPAGGESAIGKASVSTSCAAKAYCTWGPSGARAEAACLWRWCHLSAMDLSAAVLAGGKAVKGKASVSTSRAAKAYCAWGPSGARAVAACLWRWCRLSAMDLAPALELWGTQLAETCGTKWEDFLLPTRWLMEEWWEDVMVVTHRG